MWFFNKNGPRRIKVRKSSNRERLSRIGSLVTIEVINSCLIWMIFAALCAVILSFEPIHRTEIFQTAATAVIVILICLAMAFYIQHYRRKMISNYAYSAVLAFVWILLLGTAKVGFLLTEEPAWATATAVTAAIILAIAYDQRFALGMSVFYCLLVSMAAEIKADVSLFFTMAAGVFTCCFSLREIRTRMKLLEVSVLAAAMVFAASCASQFLAAQKSHLELFKDAGLHAGGTLLVGLLIQSLLPLIEKMFKTATSMTLLDYSDANQPLLRKLAMEAPGTFSHSLLVGSLSEAAAEAIGRNGLLCRVGAYYHDIGKINKPTYFIENQMGATSRHKELSPAMSQLIIVGHVKDGMELAREYKLPAVLRQFIETHHGKTLVEYFYNEARKKADEKSIPSESEFRYVGPKPQTKEAAIVMLADASEGTVRSLPEITPTRIESVVHNMAMKRLQDGQFDECDLSFRELAQIEAAISKGLAAHYHGRIAYPNPVEGIEREAPKNDSPAPEES